jgi:hypothetical protein
MAGSLSRRCSRRAAGLCLLGLSQGGCGAGWRRTGELSPGSLPPRQQVEVWHKGRAERVHALILTHDSVSGVPFLLPAGCDSCRVTLARVDVDSLRLGHPERQFWRSIGLSLGALAVLGFVACGVDLGGECQLSD